MRSPPLVFFSFLFLQTGSGALCLLSLSRTVAAQKVRVAHKMLAMCLDYVSLGSDLGSQVGEGFLSTQRGLGDVEQGIHSSEAGSTHEF